MKKQKNKKKIATTSMAVLGIGLIVGGAFAALSDTLTHNETVTIEWVDIVNGSDDDLALEDVNDVTNTPVTELTPGITYELTGTLENDSTVVTNWTATDLTTTPGMTVTIADTDGNDAHNQIGESIDVSQFGITVQVDQSVTPSTGLNFVIEFSSVDARTMSPTLGEPTAISEVFPDPAMATCVANDPESGANGDLNYLITQEILSGFDDLSCQDKGIINIEGIQYMNNLTYVDFQSNQITNIEPLENLTNLTFVKLNRNQVTDITPLTNLTNLTYLDIGNNPITDLTPLSGLINLETLSVYAIPASDFSVFEDMTNLTYINLSMTGISDLSGIENLTNLQTIYVTGCDITDVSPLASLANLQKVYINNNMITDFSSLTYQPTTFYASPQDPITLPDTTLGTPTDIVIDGINGEDLIITFNTPGTYVDGQLTWENPGYNSLTFTSADGSISGTVKQNAY